MNLRTYIRSGKENIRKNKRNGVDERIDIGFVNVGFGLVVW